MTQVREMTRSERTRARFEMSASVIPSAKNSWRSSDGTEQLLAPVLFEDAHRLAAPGLGLLDEPVALRALEFARSGSPWIGRSGGRSPSARATARRAPARCSKK